MKAILRDLRITPKKVNLVAALVRRMQVEEALVKLNKLPKEASEALYKLIHSAMANAEQNDRQQRKDLYIKELIVNRGPALKRSTPMARGRVRPLDKFSSHVSVKLGIVVPEGASVKSEVEGTGKEKEKKTVIEAVHVAGPEAKKFTPGAFKDVSDQDTRASHEKQSGSTFTPHRHSGRGE